MSKLADTADRGASVSAYLGIISEACVGLISAVQTLELTHG